MLIIKLTGVRLFHTWTCWWLDVTQFHHSISFTSSPYCCNMRHLSVDVATCMNMQSFLYPKCIPHLCSSGCYDVLSLHTVFTLRKHRSALRFRHSLTSQPWGPLHAHTINTALKSFQAIYLEIYYYYNLLITVWTELMLWGLCLLTACFILAALSFFKTKHLRVGLLFFFCCCCTV